jgi:hypothetical protein
LHRSGEKAHHPRRKKDIKAAVTPQSFELNPNKAAQKVIEARWTKKSDEVHFGCNVHVVVDNENRLISEY